MEDIVYNIKKCENGEIKIVPLFYNELNNYSYFYTGMGECQQKIIVGRNAYSIVIHPSLFSDKKDTLTGLNRMQLKLFYNLSMNERKKS